MTNNNIRGLMKNVKHVNGTSRKFYSENSLDSFFKQINGLARRAILRLEEYALTIRIFSSVFCRRRIIQSDRWDLSAVKNGINGRGCGINW